MMFDEIEDFLLKSNADIRIYQAFNTIKREHYKMQLELEKAREELNYRRNSREI